jgi:hypothetical protein
MHYTILVFSCPYICFGTSCAIIRGVVESLQFSNADHHEQEDKWYSVIVNLCCESELDAFENC